MAETTVVWYTTVVFKGSDNSKQSCEVSFSKTTPIRRFVEIVLDKFGIKDVLATVEFREYVYYGPDKPYALKTTTPENDDAPFWESLLKSGAASVYVYTDAQAPPTRTFAPVTDV